jgi:hypothetical protein
MIKTLLDLLTRGQSFAEDELRLKFKVDFLNSVFLLATVVAFGMGFFGSETRCMYCRKIL